MALNITMDGYCYFGDSSISNSNVSYQAYFYHVNSGSSSSTWNNVHLVEATGYWNINLGDGDFLTQEGSASSGDVVVLVFWSPTSAGRLDTCPSLNEWSIFRIVLDGSATYTNDVQIKPNICPNLSWSLAATGLVNVNVTATNSSTDTHQWDFSGNTMYQRDSWYTTLMSVNNIDNTDYDWGDLSQDLDLSGAASRTHSWSSSGDYDVEIVIEDDCGCTVTGTDTIRIYANTPVPNIAMTPVTPEPNEVVYFQYTGTDVDNSITNIAWTIDDGDTDTISGTNARDDIVYHTNGLGTDWYGQSANSGAFTNYGNHLVSIVITWWDGFSNQTINYSETFTQNKFSGPAVNFTQAPSEAEIGVPVTFTNTSTNTDRVGLGLPSHIEYNWRWIDDTTVENELDKPFSYELTETPTSASCSVQLCAQWSDGWDTQETCLEKDVVFGTIVTVTEEECYYNLNIIGTASDGSVTGYGWAVYSGAGSTGPWSEEWASPVGLDQNDKKICFTASGWFKIEGTVYGTGSSTSDYEIMEVTEVCTTVSGGGECTVVIAGPPLVSGDYTDDESPPTMSVDGYSPPSMSSSTTDDGDIEPPLFTANEEDSPPMAVEGFSPPRMSAVPLPLDY